MSEPKQKLIDQQLLVKLDSLRKAGTLNLGESNWYNARRPGIGGIELAANPDSASDATLAAGSAVACVEAARPLSRLGAEDDREDPLAHGVADTSA